MFKKILIISLSIIDAVLLFFGITHIVAGVNTPSLVGGGGSAYFMGFYIIAIIFMTLFIIVLVVIILLCLYMRPKEKNNERS